jgi:serine acetyltransferase
MWGMSDGLATIYRKQVRNILGEKVSCPTVVIRDVLVGAIEKVHKCAQSANVGPRGFVMGYSDHYAAVLCHATPALTSRGYGSASGQAFYLNKVLHGVQCSPNATLPDNLILWHGGPSVIGSGAAYGDYLVISQFTTVGQHRGNWPIFEGMNYVGPHSAVLGSARVGAFSSVGAGTVLVGTEVAANSVAYRNSDGKLVVSPASVTPYITRWFDPGLLAR